MVRQKSQGLIDPFSNLSLPTPATSLCFIAANGKEIFESIATADNHEEKDDNTDGYSSSDEEELTFRSTSIRKSLPGHQNTYKFEILKNRLLATCHANGDANLWDCSKGQRIAKIDGQHQAGAGMAVKRIDGKEKCFLYQTRDSSGTVAIHDTSRFGSNDSVVQKYETFSATFCQASPCRGSSHLIALPSRNESSATVMDDRDPNPVYVTTSTTNSGMVTSLAMSMTPEDRPILGCGMESGTLIFHDFSSGKSIRGEHPLSKDPILALDIVPSEAATNNTGTPSVIAAAGLAGDPVEVAELPKDEQGRVVLVKAQFNTLAEDNNSWNIRTRARMGTCKVGDDALLGKPGISNCRFRPGDSRIVAVGGWDSRVRLFDRTKGQALAILRGHAGSVNSLDWAPDSTKSGILATAGGDDCSVSFWQCFSDCKA